MSVADKYSDVPAPKGASIFVKVLVLMLWMLAFGSSVSVVYVTYESRQYTQVLEELRQKEIGLKVAAGQFQLEKSSLASYPRIESIANDKLNMASPDSSETVLVVRE